MSAAADLSPYFEIKLMQIRPGQAVPCALFIFLKTNQHLLKWKNEGDEVFPENVQKLERSGLTILYAKKTDEAKWLHYLNPPATPPPAPEAVAVIQAMQSTATPEEKAAVVAPVAQAALAKSLIAETPAEQKKAEAQNRKIIQDILQETVAASAKMAVGIFQNSALDPELSHGLNVATYATLFALAFGKIDPQVIGDLALSALIHDVGITQLPLSVAQLQGPHQDATYRSHVQLGMKLIEAQIPDLSPRVKIIVSQHHEKFDGTGYPQKLKSFDFDDIAQLLAMANLLDEFSTGHFNGTVYSSKEALLELEKIEKARNFPEYFNPEVFNAVLKWTRKESNQDLIARASQVVSDKTEALAQVGKGKAA